MLAILGLSFGIIIRVKKRLNTSVNLVFVEISFPESSPDQFTPSECFFNRNLSIWLKGPDEPTYLRQQTDDMIV